MKKLADWVFCYKTMSNEKKKKVGRDWICQGCFQVIVFKRRVSHERGKGARGCGGS